MRRFKAGNYIKLVNQDGWDRLKLGEVYRVEDVSGTYTLNNGTNVSFYYEHDFELVEDRTTWHPHHDVIVAWAKGATVRGREKGEDYWRWEWDPLDTGEPAPSWEIDWEYEVIPEPDHAAEIAEIEQEIRKLADRLEKLK